MAKFSPNLRKNLWPLLLLLFFTSFCTSKNIREEGKFSYQNLYKQYYEQGKGGLLPLTLERGESLSGSISPDGKYLYFASNRLGNYDLFLRDLNDVEIIPIIKKVTNQTEPVISPNGKYLAYIDDELDPDGDLVILKVNPKDIIDSYEKGEDPQSGIFAVKPKILTNDEKNRVRSRESNPAWSPDSKYLVFSSDMTSPEGNPFGPGFGAIQNLWLMDPDKPKEARRLTEKGGVMPSFSPDGKKIAYVSYEIPDSNGDIFEIDLTTNTIRQLTFGKALDLSPSYSQDGQFLIFTRISADTNGDGLIDRKDKGQLLALNLKDLKEEPFPLTLKEQHVFGNRSSNFLGGSLVFSVTTGENINLALIPETGVVPQKPTAQEQYEFSKTLIPQKSQDSEYYLLSLNSLYQYFSQDIQKPIFSAMGLIDGYLFCQKQGLPEAENFKAKIKKEAPQNPFLRYLIGLQRLRQKENILPEITPPVSANSPVDYLRKMSQAFEQEPEWSFANPLTQKAFKAEILYALAQEEKAAGNLIRAKELERNIINQFVWHFRTPILLEEEIKQELGEIIPRAMLFIFYPEKHPYFADKERNELLKKTVSDKTKIKMYDWLYSHFRNLQELGKADSLRQLISLYPEKEYPEVNALYHLVQAEFAIQSGDVLIAKKELPVEKNLPAVGKFRHLWKRLKGEIAELENKEAEAFSHYYEAFLDYSKEYQIPKTRSLLARTLEYYATEAKRHKEEGRAEEALLAYERLTRLQLQLQALDIEKDLVEEKALETLVELNELTFADPTQKNKLLKKVNEFYEENMDFARKYLVNSFIFGRAHLKTQVGMLRHMRYEKEGISTSQKKEVLKLFKEAEKDFRWSFFADPLFPDSYVMLGWMYQFIDTRREMIVDVADNTKDKEKFADLYPRFFPNYLFEEGIRLYQKSIDFFKDRGNPTILVSFHLNMGNNYFLLSNYAKAEENYEVVLEATEKQKYQFENDKQRALFYYHLGRSYYYTGKYRKAANALKKSLQIYETLVPLEGVSSEEQKLNRRKREVIMRQLALNADLNNEPQEAKNWYETILAEQQKIGVKEDQSFLYLELARLYLDEQNFDASLFYLRQAEESLKNEKEIKPPKFKIRIKWLGFYEPWTTIVSWIYQLPYDQVYVGENHLAFPLPTVNRYQYLYSMEAELFRQKGLYEEAKESLLKLQNFAQKDKSKHGKETLLNSHMRLGEIYYRLNDLKEARNSYQKAKKLAQDMEDFLTLQKAEKNLLIISAKEIETLEIPENEKLKMAEKELRDLEKFIAQYTESRIKKEEQKRKSKNKALRLTEEEKAKIEIEALQEIYKLAVFQGVFHFYLAELMESQIEQKPGNLTSFENWLNQREKSNYHFLAAERYFSGLVPNPVESEKDIYFIEKRDQGMRLSLNFNKGRLYQVFGLKQRALQEFQLAFQRAEEFRSDRFLALAGYRLSELTNQGGYAEKAYQIFADQSYLVAENPTLFKQISELRIKSLLNLKDYPAVIRTEDMKRFLLAREYYYRKLKFFDPELQEKYEKYLLLTTMEANRRKLIENLRLWRENAEVWEKELEKIQEDKKALEIAMITGRASGQLAPIFYRIDPFTEQALPLLYILDLKDKTVFVVVNTRTVQRRKNVVNEITFSHAEFNIKADEIEDIKKRLLSETKLEKTPEWLAFLKTVNPEQIIVSPQFFQFPFDVLYNKTPSISLNLPTARLFSRNQNVSRNRVVQIISEGGLFAGSNRVNYDFMPSFQAVSELNSWKSNSAGYSVLDYEAQLAGQEEALVEQNKLAFYQISETFMFPSVVLVHYAKNPRLSPTALFHYSGAITLLSASRGATAVIHLDQNRKANLELTRQTLIDKLNFGTVIYGFSPMREYLYTGKKNDIFLKMAELERQREMNRLRERDEQNLAQIEYRSLRAKDTEELLFQGKSENFLESQELFSLRNQLLLRQGAIEKALREWKNREAALQKQNRTKELVDEKSQMISRLFVNGFNQEAEREMAELHLTFSAKEWLAILEGYHLSALRQGKIQIFNQTLPDFYEKATRQFNLTLPNGIAERMAVFVKSSSFQNIWENLLTQNLEYNSLRKFYQNISLTKEKKFLRYYLVHKTTDKNFVPENARNFFNRLQKGEVNSKILYSQTEEAFAEKFINFYSLWEKGDYSQALLLAKNYINETNFPSEGKDAIFLTLVWDLWKRAFTPNQELAILAFFKKEAAKIAKLEKNPQRQFFYSLLALTSELRESITPLQNFLRMGIVDNPSSLNKSLINRMAYYAATYHTKDAVNFAFFAEKNYLEDEEVLKRWEFLAKISKISPSETLQLKEFWQTALVISYFRETNQNENALKTYLNFDRGITQLPKTVYPLMGIISFYPNTYWLFRLEKERVSWEDVEIKDNKDFLKFVGKEKAFYFYEMQNNNLREKNNWPFTTGMMLFAGAGQNSAKDRVGYGTTSQSHPISALFRIFLTQENKNPLVYFSPTWQDSTGLVNFSEEKVIPQKLNAGYCLVATKGKYSVYLQFAQRFLQKFKDNLDVEEAFLATQKELSTVYPLPQDYLSVHLVKF